MKLICDLCGGQLQMKPGGQSACCTNCGLEYSKERLMEMLQGGTTAAPAPAEPPVQEPIPEPVWEPVEEPVWEPVEPQMRNFYLKRKFNLSGSLAKAAIYLDGQLCAVLTAKGEACVPIAPGEHEVSVRIGVFALESMKFTVTDRDVGGLLYLDQKAFTAQWVFVIDQL